MTLGELLQQMGPGNPAGMPQIAPPMGIPWEQPQAPAPAPPPVMRNPNANMATDQRTMTRTPTPSQNTGADAIASLMSWLNSQRQPLPGMPSMPEAYNGPEANQGLDEYGAPAGYSSAKPSTVPPPGKGPAPSFGGYNGPEVNQGLDQYGAPAGYSMARPSTVPPAALSDMLYTDSNIPLPERKGTPSAGQSTQSKPGTPSLPSRGNPATGGSSGTSRSRASTFTEAPNTDLGQPKHEPYFGGAQQSPSTPGMDPMLGKFLLQMGLNLMVPQWGNPLSQIGQAAGAGAAAVDRSRTADTKNELDRARIDVEREKASKIGMSRKGATGSSAGKRLKEKTPAQAFASNLSPEASLYFNQRIKDLNKVDADNNETPDKKYSAILAETQAIDRRTRAARGMARSEEIPDTVLDKVAGTPQESAALSAVAGDPVQHQLMIKRLEAIKTAKAATNANAAGKPK